MNCYFILICISSVQAGTYQAMRGGTKSNEFVSGKQINTPYGTIPAKRFTKWGFTGKSQISFLMASVAYGLRGRLVDGLSFLFC